MAYIRVYPAYIVLRLFVTTAVGIRWHKLNGCSLLRRVPHNTSGEEGKGMNNDVYAACRTLQVSRQITAYSYIIPAEHMVADGLQLTGAKTNDSFISMFLLNLQCGWAECRGSAPSAPFWIRPCYTSDTYDTHKENLDNTLNNAYIYH